jgi:hypothetical protein
MIYNLNYSLFDRVINHFQFHFNSGCFMSVIRKHLIKHNLRIFHLFLLISTILIFSCSYLPSSYSYLLENEKRPVIKADISILNPKDHDTDHDGYPVAEYQPNNFDVEFSWRFKNLFISPQIAYTNLAFSTGYILKKSTVFAATAFADPGGISGRLNITQRVWRKLFISADYFRCTTYLEDELQFPSSVGAQLNCLKLNIDALYSENDYIGPILGINTYAITNFHYFRFGLTINIGGRFP